jgi:aminopeptidase N
MLTPLRTCYDVRYYHLDVKVDPSNQSIAGSNTIRFTVLSALDRMQIDLFRNMEIMEITLDGGAPLPYTREFDAVFVQMPEKLTPNTSHDLAVFYSGKPVVAKAPPWDGGFTWTRDSTGNPWVVVTCQGTGASLWWPNKDHQSDKPDSMLITVTVPPGLEDVSNGRLRASRKLADGWTRFDWFVSSPINNYSVTVNIGKYAHFSDTWVSADTLTLDYYVLPVNLERARLHFQQVKPMMAAFEKYFGPYPFRKDGYKLIECPHTGMEHQSAVAYGNRYLGGYRGRASSEVGLKFDFIIVHESAHEWWGNSVTAGDAADMWIHESFGAYAEALFVEYLYGRSESLRYINAKKTNVANMQPIVGVFNVNHPGAGDMYDKGQLVLNTFRTVLDNDSLWFSLLKGVAETFRHKTIDGSDLVRFINRMTGKEYTSFFDQYLKHPRLPRLEFMVANKGDSAGVRYRWKADVQNFQMPVRLLVAGRRPELITPTASWQTMRLAGVRPGDLGVAEDLYYIDLKVHWVYLDPALPDR